MGVFKLTSLGFGLFDEKLSPKRETEEVFLWLVKGGIDKLI